MRLARTLVVVCALAMAGAALVIPAPGAANGALTISGMHASPRIWREPGPTNRGSRPAKRRSRRVPVGTTIRFRLSEAATVRLAFRRTSTTVVPSGVVSGSRLFPGRAGANGIAFDGQLGAHTRLALGRYVVTATASAGSGARARAARASFTIVR